MMASRTPYATHYGVVINRAKFDVCTHRSFRGVKTNSHTDGIALYVLDIFGYHCFHCDCVDFHRVSFCHETNLTTLYLRDNLRGWPQKR